MAEEQSKKRAKEQNSNDDESEDEMIGPLPVEASKPKKKKVLEFEQVYLDNLPSSESYEKSYMHRDFITHVVVTRTDFLVTASCDGHVKFWKKTEEGVEFVKHYRGHLGSICCTAASVDGLLFCSVANDKSLKVFDVVNFDMINMMKIGYEPGQCEWIYSRGAAIAALACSEKDSGKIHIYDGRGNNVPLNTIGIHTKPITFIKYNSKYDVAVSADEAGMIEYWSGLKGDFKFPQNVNFQYKTDTDLFEFIMCKAVPTSLAFAPDGKLFATMATDRKVRVFRFLSGKKVRVFDEDLQVYTDMQQSGQHLPDMEFGRRMAGEKDLEKTKNLRYSNVTFDESGYFLLYATLFGIKVINIHTNRCVRIIGKNENVRFLSLALYQGKPSQGKAAITLETEAADNPSLNKSTTDPTIFCTANKKNRFYVFTRRDPDQSVEGDRDVFNEKPSREEIYAATESSGGLDRVAESVVIHTSMGDIQVKLFVKECPKTVENFVVHSRNGYYNGQIFHRVIKQFMIQTGDPLGDGTGGESIWGGEFEDELHHNLRHDRPYTLSMANAGPNTNGSQFFITVVPAPWLDNKHTVFGRVVRGMDVVQEISNVSTNPRDDRPYEEVKVLNIAVK
ncbi:peptidylprolyl isomerase domain and WD repeat-containing protein 1-like [Dendronephthya gigantea]|uniref:peptidylprolyl isomerase domain and WD repeat-containing protein 1-like n=1 Tax=Dendronephthya gigantea TaxID=151771 RepID=UPI00106A6765|nr:peptidylprolyl isomerase domain and WD repeat-containing protein 1-like [Dendronephthya gigantea]XP_028401227.1 peptidylprolyl isomerase domain and WD repeat-containing protein 1-like [Dendronephthya gigantea]XP_028401228.1 peptidylprolyl isomerase domain and WD repeat-containing protein 1-like [Dendronephthya gigantea]XP_028401229.1 peptidylprolyl isomerase domain and WD repeat-containing protein 1-like [Dendronephthya gigantea]